MIRFFSIALFAGFLATGCSSGTAKDDGDGNGINDPGGDDDDDSGGPIVGDGDPSAISIELTSPERGTLSDASEVTVAGRVTSTGGSTISGVTVNGTAADLATDGSFELSLPL